MDIDHEIFSTIIISFLLIQEGQSSVSGERMFTSTDLLLRGLSLHRKNVVRSTNQMDITLIVLTGAMKLQPNPLNRKLSYVIFDQCRPRPA